MPSHVAAVLLAVALLSSAAEAQTRRPTRRITSQGWPAAPAARTSDVLADSAAVASVPSDATPPAAPTPAPVSAPAVVAPAAQTTLHAFGRTGLRVALPAGWNGPTTSDEGRLPAFARYTFASAAPGPLAGAVLRVEHVTGLNPLDEQRWRVGQTAAGYGGARPTGPIAVPLPALVAFETAGAGTGGAVAFLQRGRTFWAVAVEAPAALWQARRADLVALMAGVDVPSAPTASR